MVEVGKFTSHNEQIEIQSFYAIHFVCTGNVYRSRLAESYLKSKHLPGVVVSSSGIEARRYYAENGPIAWTAMRLIQKYHLISFMKPMSETTTAYMLAQADLIIFMNTDHYDYARQYLGYRKINYEIWHILDIGDLSDARAILQDTMRTIDVTEKTFEDIKQKIDKLVEILP